MTREECERAMAKHLIAIADIYNEYAPDREYLDVYINNRWENINGNDYGNWDMRSIRVNNAYYEGGNDEDAPISFEISKDIEDEKYNNVVSRYLADHPEDKDEFYNEKWHLYDSDLHIMEDLEEQNTDRSEQNDEN